MVKNGRPKPISSAKFMRSLAGSQPELRMKIRGEMLMESLYVLGKSNGGGWMYLISMFSITKFCSAGAILSGRRARSTHARHRLPTIFLT